LARSLQLFFFLCAWPLQRLETRYSIFTLSTVRITYELNTSLRVKVERKNGNEKMEGEEVDGGGVEVVVEEGREGV